MNYYTEGIIAANLAYAVCTEPKKFHKEMKRLKVDAPGEFTLNGSGATVHFFEQDDRCIAILCINVIKEHLEFVALLAHEAYHIHRENMKMLHESEPGEEVSAYSVQIILQTVLHELVKVKLKFKE